MFPPLSLISPPLPSPLIPLLSPSKAPGGHELLVDYWEVVGPAPPGGVENLVNEDSHIDVQLDQRHMMLRGDTVRAWAGRTCSCHTLAGRRVAWLSNWLSFQPLQFNKP